MNHLYTPLLFWALLALACVPSLIGHLGRLWKFEQYHYLPALGLALIWLVYTRWDRKLNASNHWSGWLLLCLGLLTLLGGIVLPSAWLGAMGFVLLLGSWLAFHQDIEGGSLVGIWPLSWLILSLPMGYDDTLTNWLQLESTRLSSFFMDMAKIPHAQFGNVIELAKEKLFVEQACSGVQSLYSLVFVAFLIVVALRRPALLLPLYFLAATFWAGLMNVFRIFSIAVASHYYHIDLAHGWQHQVLGYCCLGIATLLLLSTDRLIRVVFFPIEAKEENVGESNPWVYTWNRYLRLPSLNAAVNLTSNVLIPRALQYGMVGFAVLIAGGAWLQFASSSTHAKEGTAKIERKPFLALPESLASLGVVGFEQSSYERVRGEINLPFGEHADVWHGVVKGIPITVAVNQPYPDWHDLCLCYQGNGLQLNSKQTVADPDWNYVNARLVNQGGDVTHLWFSALDDQGNPVDAPSNSILSRWVVRLKSGTGATTEFRNSSEIALIQLVCESSEFLLPESNDMLTEFYLQVRTSIRKSFQKSE